MERYNVYDRVWTMVGEKPSELIVFAVIESMDGKRSTEIYYRLVRRSSGAVWGETEGIERHQKEVFPSKRELIASL